MKTGCETNAETLDSITFPRRHALNPKSGDQIGDYEILELVGGGGMGKVYRVRNGISDCTDAMKIPSPDLAGEPEMADRFVREIKVLARLKHPNIAALRTALRVGNQPVMIMEFVKGVTLEARLRKGDISLPECLNYASQVLEALSYAHEQGVIHRDIKPANMMLMPNGVVKLMDFGIACQCEDQRLVQTGAMLGSIHYMAPEQLRGVQPDARSDLYSLGISLYELVTGQKPFHGDSNCAIMNAHLYQPPRPPIELRPGLPAKLNEVILTAIAKAPDRRYQSAEAFRDALKTLVAPVDEFGTYFTGSSKGCDHADESCWKDSPGIELSANDFYGPETNPNDSNGTIFPDSNDSRKRYTGQVSGHSGKPSAASRAQPGDHGQGMLSATEEVLVKGAAVITLESIDRRSRSQRDARFSPPALAPATAAWLAGPGVPRLPLGLVLVGVAIALVGVLSYLRQSSKPAMPRDSLANSCRENPVAVPSSGDASLQSGKVQKATGGSRPITPVIRDSKGRRKRRTAPQGPVKVPKPTLRLPPPPELHHIPLVSDLAAALTFPKTLWLSVRRSHCLRNCSGVLRLSSDGAILENNNSRAEIFPVHDIATISSVGKLPVIRISLKNGHVSRFRLTSEGDSRDSNLNPMLKKINEIAAKSAATRP